jgi:glycosidase
VGGYLMRSIRWLVDYTKLDGLRLDAVKHVPAYFFGDQYGGDKDSSSSGYIGQASGSSTRRAASPRPTTAKACSTSASRGCR